MSHVNAYLIWGQKQKKYCIIFNPMYYIHWSSDPDREELFEVLRSWVAGNLLMTLNLDPKP